MADPDSPAFYRPALSRADRRHAGTLPLLVRSCRKGSVLRPDLPEPCRNSAASGPE